MTTQQLFPPAARRIVLKASLRGLWLLQLLLLALLVALFHARGHSWAVALAVVAGSWLTLAFAIAALSFVGKWALGDWPAEKRGQRGQWLRTALVEIGWMMRMYLVDQPWRRAPERLLAQNRRTPVMLVHGFLCNGAVWRALARQLDASGRSYATVSLEPSYRHFQQQLDDLDAAVQALCTHTGSDRVVLVGHSMGGLLARAYAERHPARCAGVVCVAAPHHGTHFGDLFHGLEGGPPSPRCQWLQQFNTRSEERIGVPALNLWSADDNIVIPAASAMLSATVQRALHGHGHMALIAAPLARATVLAAIDELDPPGEKRE